jgi:hypothetical protein
VALQGISSGSGQAQTRGCPLRRSAATERRLARGHCAGQAAGPRATGCRPDLAGADALQSVTIGTRAQRKRPLRCRGISGAAKDRCPWSGPDGLIACPAPRPAGGRSVPRRWKHHDGGPRWNPDGGAGGKISDPGQPRKRDVSFKFQRLAEFLAPATGGTKVKICIHHRCLAYTRMA